MARLTQDEMDRRLQEVGGGKMVHARSAGKRKVTNPDYDKYDRNSSETIELDIEQWKSPDGHTIQAVHMPDGTWEIIQDEPAAPRQTTTPPRTPEQTQADAANAQTAQARAENETKLNWERDWHEKQGHGRYTHAEWEDKLDKDKQQALLEGNQARANQLAADRLAWDKEKAALPDVRVETVKGGDGRSYTRVVTTSKDGKDVSVRIIGPDGKDAAEIPGEGVGALAPDFPRYNPDLTKPGAGIHDYQKAVDDWMAANPGKMTFENRQKVLAEANERAKTIVGEWNTAAGILKEQYQQEVTQRSQDITQAGNRLASADRGLQMANGLIEKFAPYLGANPGDASKLFQGQLAAQIIQAGVMGGLDTPGRVELDPRLGAFVDRTLGPAGGAAGSGAGAAAAAPPQPTARGADGLVRAPDGTPYLPGNGDREYPGLGAWFTPTGNPAMNEAQRQAEQANQAGIATTGQPTAGEPGGPPLVPAEAQPGAGVAAPAINPVTGEPTGLAPLPNTPPPLVTPPPVTMAPGGDPGLLMKQASTVAYPGEDNTRPPALGTSAEGDTGRRGGGAFPDAAPLPGGQPGTVIMIGPDGQQYPIAASDLPSAIAAGRTGANGWGVQLPNGAGVSTEDAAAIYRADREGRLPPGYRPSEMPPSSAPIPPNGGPNPLHGDPTPAQSTDAYKSLGGQPSDQPPGWGGGAPRANDGQPSVQPGMRYPMDWQGPGSQPYDVTDRDGLDRTLDPVISSGEDGTPLSPAPAGRAGGFEIGPGTMNRVPISQGSPAYQAGQGMFGKSLPESLGASWQDDAMGLAMKQAPRPVSPVAERLFGRGLPQPAASRIPGVTPEIDDIARRELLAEAGLA